MVVVVVVVVVVVAVAAVVPSKIVAHLSHRLNTAARCFIFLGRVPWARKL